MQATLAQSRYGRENGQDQAAAQSLQELQSLESALEKHPEARRLADELKLRTISQESIQSALQPEEVLLNYFVVDNDIFAQILHQDGEHHLARLEAAGVHERVAELHSLLRTATAAPLYLSDPPLQDLLQFLYAALIKPIDSALRLSQNLKSLVISGDSFLYSLPWELLMLEGGTVSLLELVKIRLIPTPRDLVRLHRMEEIQTEHLNSALLLGVQNFEGEGESQHRGIDQDFPTRDGLRTFTRKTLPHYRNLTGTQVEVERIAKTFEHHGLNTVALLSPEATEQTLLNLRTAPSILHLATHSDIWTPEAAQRHYGGPGNIQDVRVDPSHPFSRAIVVLDGYDQESFRGVVRAWELASLNLAATQMVTFSSCNSGLGDMSAGRSVAGLSQAAFLAGARRTITTLWPVSDLLTPEWITKVYQRRLEGASWQDAVHASKLELLEDEAPLNAWAPFVLNGLA